MVTDFGITYGDGSSDELSEAEKQWNRKAGLRLYELHETYPLENDFVIWTFAALTGKENLTREKKSDLLGYSDKKLRNTYKKYKAILNHLEKNGLEETKQEWANKNVVTLKEAGRWSEASYGLSYEGTKTVISSSDNIDGAPNYAKQYGLHQRLLVLLPAFKEININVVEKFANENKESHEKELAVEAEKRAVAAEQRRAEQKIKLEQQKDREAQRKEEEALVKAEKKEKRELARVVRLAEEAKEKALHMDFSDINSILDIQAPVFEKSEIQEKAKNLNPLSATELTGYGNDVSIEASNVVSWLTHYFTKQATKPRNLLSHIDNVVEEINAFNVENTVESDPGRIERMLSVFSSSVQLVPLDEMPLASIKEKAMRLPQIAAQDDLVIEKELQIVDHLMTVLNDYHNILDAHREALIEQTPHLQAKADQKEGLIAEVMRTNVPASIERTLGRLAESQTMLRIFAGNFHQMSLCTAEARQRLSSISSLAATLQLPIVDAIQSFRAHELRRQNMLGRSIEGEVDKQLGRGSAKAYALEDFTAEKTQAVITQALSKMTAQLELLPNQLLRPFEERSNVAETMQQTMIKGPVQG